MEVLIDNQEVKEKEFLTLESVETQGLQNESLTFKNSPTWRKKVNSAPLSRQLRHSTSDLPALTPQLQQEMQEEEDKLRKLEENTLTRSVSDIVKAIETTQHPNPNSPASISFPNLNSPYFTSSVPNSPHSSSPIMIEINEEMEGERPRKRSFLRPSLLEIQKQNEEDLAISEEESVVSPQKCWCFQHPAALFPTSPRLKSGGLDLDAVREKEELKERVEQEKNREAQTKEEIQFQLVTDKLDEFQATYEGYKSSEDVFDNFQVTEPNYIGFGVYLSSFMGAKSLEVMQGLNIRFILVAACKLALRYPQDLDYLQLDVLDWPGEDLLSHFDYACDYMRDAIYSNANVLVHCSAGVSRSASCVIAYIMREHGVNFYLARKLVRGKRDCIKPNRGFVRQLLLWERFHYDIRSDREIYLGWKMEAYYKEARMAPFSIVQLGIDPLDIFKKEYMERLLKEYTSFAEDEAFHNFTLLCCKRCERWLFTRLNLEVEHSTENYYSVDRMSWMKTLDVHGRISCPRCLLTMGSYSLHHQIMDGENVPKFLVEKAKLKEQVLSVPEIVKRGETESTLLLPFIEIVPTERFSFKKTIADDTLTPKQTISQNTLKALLL